MTPIAIYGATGRLGRAVAAELIGRGADIRLAARSADKLADVVRALARDTPWHAVSLNDAAGLKALLAGCRVLVNAAGSRQSIGDRLIEAALESKVHYIDAAGEQPHIGRLFDRYDEPAKSAGVALVPAFGFDYAIGDGLAGLASKAHQPVREISVAYAIDGPDVSGNSLKFAAEQPAGDEVFFESGRWVAARTDIFRRTMDFPAPFGRQSMARYGSGEIVTVPHHVQTDAVTALITTRSLVPHPALIPVFPYLRPIVAWARRTPARYLLGLAARRRKPAAPDDSAPPVRRFAIVVLAEGRDGTLGRAVAEGGDFHQITSATLAFGATALASPTFDVSGTLAPAMAVDPVKLFEALRPLGFSWRVERSGTTPHTR